MTSDPFGVIDQGGHHHRTAIGGERAFILDKAFDRLSCFGVQNLPRDFTVQRKVD